MARRKSNLRQGHRQKNLNLFKNIRNGPLNNERMYYEGMSQNFEFSLQREDSIYKEELENSWKMWAWNLQLNMEDVQLWFGDV